MLFLYNLEERCQISVAVNQCKMMQRTTLTYWEDYWYLGRKLSPLIQNPDSLTLKKHNGAGENLKRNV